MKFKLKETEEENNEIRQFDSSIYHKKVEERLELASLKRRYFALFLNSIIYSVSVFFIVLKINTYMIANNLSINLSTLKGKIINEISYVDTLLLILKQNEWLKDFLLEGLISIVILMSINTILLFCRGQNLGKFLLGIYIAKDTSIEGEKANIFKIIFLRSIPFFMIGFIPIIGIIFIIFNLSFAFFTKKKQCLHDLIAGTVVFRK